MIQRPGELWVVRHADTDWSNIGRHTGRTNIPLSRGGRETPAALRERLQGQAWDLVHTSPLERARDTCRLAGFEGAERDELVEWDYGSYEGETTPQIRERRPDWDLWRHGAPGGEDAAAVGRRVDRLLGSLPDDAGKVVIFSHGHVLRVLAARWLGLAPEHGALFALAPGGIGVLGWERERRVMRSWG
ncbi:MAG: histidine phosphatase family protein [Solirubrobacteraceae bacterium]